MPGNSPGFCLQGHLLHAAPLLSGVPVQPVFHAFPYAHGDGVLSSDRGLGGRDAVHLQASERPGAELFGEALRHVAGGTAPGNDLLLHDDEPHEIRNRRSGAGPFDGSLLLRKHSGASCTDHKAEDGRSDIGRLLRYCMPDISDRVYGAADCFHRLCTSPALRGAGAVR